eukprot:CAMPEP_0170209768 /NCGR_PEP_ID=MMETSP0116_2-20130129/4475_1 /TAXON_ID=400756 /ORGANISM="Durinskia baltica, Strain CSIRO CS-38" /LENGTH=78 /DNA_ID=CAMNT_0010460253 /DNA_START=18 /DNA_END=254 /DNA_ORIENTATION=+
MSCKTKANSLPTGFPASLLQVAPAVASWARPSRKDGADICHQLPAAEKIPNHASPNCGLRALRRPVQERIPETRRSEN